MPKHEASAVLGAGAAASAVAGIYKVAEFMNKAKRMRDVGPANSSYVQLVHRVRRDLDEVQRLLTVPEIKDALRDNRPKAEWIYTCIKDTRHALEIMEPLTERVDSDLKDGRHVGIRHRLKWLLSEHEKLQNREIAVNSAHASLLEVLGFLTALEPVDESGKHERHDTRHNAEAYRNEQRYYEAQPERIEERETWVEHEHAPRRVEERETWVEREGPRRIEEHYYETHPRRSEDREIHVERDPRHGSVHIEEQRYDRDPRHAHIEERYYDRDPRHEELRYAERGPGRYEEQRYERRYSDEDRVPERETFMSSASRRGRDRYVDTRGPGGFADAEYGRHRVVGDAGFGDQEVLNPQPVPPMNRAYDREVWIEEREDYRYDQYGNRLPDRYFPNRNFRSRM